MIKKGDSGEAVRAVQAQLHTLGFLKPSDVDGKFGKVTDAAVRAFQFAHKLKVDGVYGDMTHAALGEAVHAKLVADGLLTPARAADAPVSSATSPEKQPELSQTRANPESENRASGAFTDGWYDGARRCPLHPGRIGAVINPKGVVFHTTDTMGGMAGMLQRWHEARGDGGGAHFMLGRRAPTAAELLDEEWPSAGLVQMVPINHNGNHAGGPYHQHGKVIVDGKPWHPNSHYIGIEVVGGGRLVQTGSVVRHPDTQRVVPNDEVWRDERGKPWHLITEYQFEVLGKLLDDLDREMVARFPDGAKLQPNGSYQLNGVTWGAMPGLRFVGHVTLDPIRKTDPGPQGIAWLRERYGDRG